MIILYIHICRFIDIQYRFAVIQYRVAGIQYRVAGIQYRFACIQYRFAVIQYRVADIQYRFAGIQYRYVGKNSVNCLHVLCAVNIKKVVLLLDKPPGNRGMGREPRLHPSPLYRGCGYSCLSSNKGL